MAMFIDKTYETITYGSLLVKRHTVRKAKLWMYQLQVSN